MSLEGKTKPRRLARLTMVSIRSAVTGSSSGRAAVGRRRGRSPGTPKRTVSRTRAAPGLPARPGSPALTADPRLPAGLALRQRHQQPLLPAVLVVDHGGRPDVPGLRDLDVGQLVGLDAGQGGDAVAELRQRLGPAVPSAPQLVR